ncbi:terminase small subunit [Sporosarcina gallistercoris]|uniref:terminase small subunit n=1 Tax=Sporosarcina gallistercoris TaxID=2762245 RepID=UPI003D2C2BE1
MIKRHRDFADYYIELANTEKAALKAGYSESYARSRAYELLEHPGVKEYIQEQMERISSEKIVQANEILIHLSSVMRGEALAPVLIGVGGGKQEVVMIPSSATERLKAAELLGKRYFMWTEKHHIEMAGAVTFIDDIGSEYD